MQVEIFLCRKYNSKRLNWCFIVHCQIHFFSKRCFSRFIASATTQRKISLQMTLRNKEGPHCKERDLSFTKYTNTTKNFPEISCGGTFKRENILGGGGVVPIALVGGGLCHGGNGAVQIAVSQKPTILNSCCSPANKLSKYFEDNS